MRLSLSRVTASAWGVDPQWGHYMTPRNTVMQDGCKQNTLLNVMMVITQQDIICYNLEFLGLDNVVEYLLFLGTPPLPALSPNQSANQTPQVTKNKQDYSDADFDKWQSCSFSLFLNLFFFFSFI